MSEIALFFVGLLVTGVVGAAVSLLLWGAANEPDPGESITVTREDDEIAARRAEAEGSPALGR